MKVAIMQPYFLPYIGYWQLLNAVDKFVIYDNIEFTKKGWFHRNRILMNGEARMFTVPVRKDSDYLNVDQRFLGENAQKTIDKILGQIRSSYTKATHFPETYQLVESCFKCDQLNLFDFILWSILKIKEHLQIDTELIRSSKLEIDHGLRGEDKVLEICDHLHATEYMNPIGGLGLYDKTTFLNRNIDIGFLETTILPYQQFDSTFVPLLSIIDVLMFNSKSKVQEMLFSYKTQ